MGAVGASALGRPKACVAPSSSMILTAASAACIRVMMCRLVLSRFRIRLPARPGRGVGRRRAGCGTLNHCRLLFHNAKLCFHVIENLAMSLLTCQERMWPATRTPRFEASRERGIGGRGSLRRSMYTLRWLRRVRISRCALRWRRDCAKGQRSVVTHTRGWTGWRPRPEWERASQRAGRQPRKQDFILWNNPARAARHP